MTRALYPLRYFPTLTETFVANEVRGAAALGHTVSIAALGERADGALAEPMGVPVHRVPRRPLRGLLSRPTAAMRQVAAWQRPKDAARLPWLRHLASDHDVVHVHFAGEAAELAWAVRQDGGPPYVVMVHAVDLFKPRPSLPRVLSDAAAVLTVARHHQARLAAMGVQAEVVRCGPVLADWAQVPPPPDGPLRALFVGRNVPKKGLQVLLDAWEGAPPRARLTVVSDADVQAPGVRCQGLLSPAALRAEVAACNAVVLPCRQAEDGDLDGVPLVLMEALAARRAVVTTPVSGIPELVDDAVGWLVPPDDPAALVNTLVEVHENVAQREIRGGQGPQRLRARGFCRSRQVAGVVAVWDRVG